MIVTTPIYLASFRKVTAMSSLVAQICVPAAMSEHRAAAVRLIVSQVFILVSLMVMTFFTVLLSTSILSSLKSMVLLLLIVTVAAMLFRATLVRIYSRAEIALNETLLELPLLDNGAGTPMPELLREAELGDD